MKIKLTRTLGYCLGVRRAMDTAFRELSRGQGPVYSHGELIHNAPALDLLSQKGLRLWNGEPEGSIIIRAHGLPPEEQASLEASGLKVSDATCPRVRAVQNLVAREAEAGRTVIIWGKADHPEVAGLVGHAAGRAVVAAGPGEVEELNLPAESNILLVSQTTQDVFIWPQMTEAVLARWPGAVIKNTICEATETRQADVRRLCGEVEALLVIGGKTSGNTARLADIGRRAGLPTYLVETAAEVEPEWLKGLESLGVAAGASTSTWQIAQLLERLRALARRNDDFSEFWPRLLRVAVLAGLYGALGLASLAMAAASLLDRPPPPILFSFFFFLATSLHLMRDLAQGRSRSQGQALRFNDPDRTVFFAKYGRPLKIYGLIAAGLAVLAAVPGGANLIAVLLTAWLAALIYLFLPRPHGAHSLSLGRTLVGPAALAGGWALLMVTAGSAWPPQWNGYGLLRAVFVIGAVFGPIFVLSVMGDVIGAQGDRIFGRPTLPTVYGEKTTRRLLEIFLLAWAAALAVGALGGFLPGLAWLMILSGPVYNAFLLNPLFRNPGIYGFHFEALLYGQLILTGLMVILWTRLPL
ncbi:4-hydroxy-3-methylbut-2-enyl diphosphate reductase [Deltaproteobacteria bacterium OttesenSCG-928-M10]|nr:4-hydroxy-3-methylbut-2-enyl diphosphate reductase [Deltaproteobacteria bacterium OttesenSCG-928-M10]